MGINITRADLKDALENNNLEIEAAAGAISAKLIQQLAPVLERMKADLAIEFNKRRELEEKAKKKLAEIEEQRKARREIYEEIEDGLTFTLCAAARKMSVNAVKRLYFQEFRAVENINSKPDASERV